MKTRFSILAAVMLVCSAFPAMAAMTNAHSLPAYGPVDTAHATKAGTDVRHDLDAVDVKLTPASADRELDLKLPDSERVSLAATIDSTAAAERGTDFGAAPAPGARPPSVLHDLTKVIATASDAMRLRSTTSVIELDRPEPTPAVRSEPC